MIAVETNILVYAHRADLAWNETARARIESLAAGPAAWAVPMHCLHEFFAVVTRAALFLEPTPVRVALEQVERLMNCDNLRVLPEDGEHWQVLRSLLEPGKVSGAAVHDARIAACCIRHGVSELWTADRDFSRYPALRTRNPLIEVQERRRRYRTARA